MESSCNLHSRETTFLQHFPQARAFAISNLYNHLQIYIYRIQFLLRLSQKHL